MRKNLGFYLIPDVSLINKWILWLIVIFVFKSLNSLAPIYRSDMLCPHNPLRMLGSGDLGLISVRRSRLDWAFAIVVPKLRNSLPVSIGVISLRLHESISFVYSISYVLLRVYLYLLIILFCTTLWSTLCCLLNVLYK